jgi:hypothetical protein
VEVIVPRRTHRRRSRGFTPEYGWQWTSRAQGDVAILPILSRRPSLNAAELLHDRATPIRLTAATNRYLFSTSGPAGPIEIRTLPRR